jgi:hypothetical protein
MAGLRTDLKTMRDVPQEPQSSSIAQYIDSLPEERSFTDKLKGNTSLDIGDTKDHPLIGNFMDAIRTGQLDEARVQKLMKRNPMAASAFATAFDEYKRASTQQSAERGILSSNFGPGDVLPPDQAGPVRPQRANFGSAISGLIGMGSVETAGKLAGIEKQTREGGGKGMYGGIRTGIIPGTKQLIEYGVDEATGQVKEVGTGRVLVRGKDYEPTVGQTIMPVLGGGLQAIPNRGGIGAPLPSSPTGLQAMPSEAETVKTGQTLNANQMAQRMFDLVNTDQVKVGPYEGRKLSASTITGIGLTPEDAELASLEENYSNAMIQAARGAQVGPAEQEKFEKSLPRRNQPKAVFLANIKTTTNNINRLNAISARLRAVPALKGKEKVDLSAPALPGGFVYKGSRAK